MSQPFAVDSDSLRALAAAWDDVVTDIVANAGPETVHGVQSRLAGSHTTWVCGQAAHHAVIEVIAAADRIAAMAGATQSSASTYDGVDDVQGDLYSGMGN